MRPPRALSVVPLAVALLVTESALAVDLDFTADRACLSPGSLVLHGASAHLGDALVTAGTVTLSDAQRVATELTVRPCACAPVGFFARRVRLSSDTSLTLDGARLALGSVSLPFAPRWWVVWGQRVGAVLPRLEVQGGQVAIGPGVHLPLGESLSADAWVLARTDGAAVEAEIQGDGGTLRGVALVGGDAAGGGVLGAARGALSWPTGTSVTSLRVDGATTDAAGRGLSRTPAEALRAGDDAALGTSVGTNAIAAGSMEIARRGVDMGARTMLALAAPTMVVDGTTVVSSQAAVASWIDRGEMTTGEAGVGLTTQRAIGPLDAMAYARGEAYGVQGTTGGWTGVGRAGGALSMTAGRAFGRAMHRVTVSLGGGAEAGTVIPRAVADGSVVSDLRGGGWRWLFSVMGRAGTGGELPVQGEAHTSLAVGGMTLAGDVVGDTVLADARATVRWADAIGNGLEVLWVHHERSAWDGVPSWVQPASGPLDLEGVRARLVTGETLRAAGTVLPGPLSLRAEAAVDTLTGTLVEVGGALRWRARCGCAWVEVGGFEVRGGDLMGLVTAQLGRR